jgi:DHA2 family multidrug resistance protein
MGYVATWAGLVAAPSGVVAVILTPFAARILNKVDARWAATVAVGAFAISFWMRSDFTPDANFGAFVAPMLVQGVAMSVFFISLVTISLNGVPGPQVPAATGLSNFVRITAGAFAASLATTLQDQGAAQHQTRLAEVVSSNNPQMVGTLHSLTQAGLSSQQALGAVNRQFENQAYLLSTLDLFRISAWICILVLPLIWLTKPARPAGTGAPPPAD